jgi:hypothetical protein
MSAKPVYSDISVGQNQWRNIDILYKRMVPVIFALIVFIACLPDCANAFNGRRRGFILGGGAGPAYARVKSDRHLSESVGLQSEFIIGGGISDQIMLSYSGLQFWGSRGRNKVGFALLPSAEVRYFFTPEAPSPFANGGFGLVLYDNDSGEWGLGGGFSPHIGFGYEFASHFSVEVDALYTFGTDLSHKPLFNIMIILTALAY